jgi:dolichyl-phosphate beta-glucosyltransferase
MTLPLAQLVPSSATTTGTSADPAVTPVPPGVASLRRPAVEVEVVIPAYNEEQRLPETLQRTAALLAARPWTSRIVVVDNGSVDATAEVGSSDWSGVDVCVIGCARPGKGAAVRRGLLTSSAEIVGFMDADLATPIDTLDRVVEEVRDGADVVIGSRYLPDSEFTIAPTTTRKAGTAAFRRISRRLVPDIADTQCGFKFFRRDVVAPVLRRSETDGFTFDLEVLTHSVRLGYDIREVPVRWTAQPGSTFRPLRDGGPSFAAALRLLRKMA